MSVVEDATAEQRFEHLFAAYEGHVMAYCLRRIDPDQAIDCTAETFLVAWRRIADVPAGGGALPWLYRTAHNVIGDHYRHRARSRTLLGALRATVATDSGDEPETVVVRREADAEVLRALQRLRPADQEVLRLALWEELPHREIGELLGCSAHAVDQRVHRAAKRLGRELRSTARRAFPVTPRINAQRGE